MIAQFSWSSGFYLSLVNRAHGQGAVTVLRFCIATLFILTALVGGWGGGSSPAAEVTSP